MSESINYLAVFLIGFITAIITLGIGFYIFKLFTRIRNHDPLDLGEPRNPYETIRALNHLPERDDPKNLIKWSLERTIKHLAEVQNEIKFLDEQGINLGGYGTYINTDIIKFATHLYQIILSSNGYLTQDQVNMVLRDYDYHVDKEVRENPVMERNKNTERPSTITRHP